MLSHFLFSFTSLHLVVLQPSFSTCYSQLMEWLFFIKKIEANRRQLFYPPNSFSISYLHQYSQSSFLLVAMEKCPYPYLMPTPPVLNRILFYHILLLTKVPSIPSGTFLPLCCTLSSNRLMYFCIQICKRIFCLKKSLLTSNCLYPPHHFFFLSTTKYF